jgi:glutamate racemase
MKIGVFDSGIGGLSVANAIQQELPELEIVYANDREHIPYGDKSHDELLGFVLPILRNLVNQGCQALVIACNTATTVLRDDLRTLLDVPIVGIEPMIKPAAALTKTGVIAVCATPGTLASDRYKWLKSNYATDVQVLEPDCSRWAYMIEHKKVDEEFIARQIQEVCDQNADVIVLGCTHYHWIETEIKSLAAGRAEVIQPEKAVVAQLKRVLEQLA